MNMPHVVNVKLILKAESSEQAREFVEKRLGKLLVEWLDEDLAPRSATPYEPGSLLHWNIKVEG